MAQGVAACEAEVKAWVKDALGVTPDVSIFPWFAEVQPTEGYRSVDAVMAGFRVTVFTSSAALNRAGIPVETWWRDIPGLVSHALNAHIADADHLDGPWVQCFVEADRPRAFAVLSG